MSDTTAEIMGDQRQCVKADADTPPAPLNQSRDVRQCTYPPISTPDTSKLPLQCIIECTKKLKVPVVIMAYLNCDCRVSEKAHQTRFSRNALLERYDR